MAAAHVAGAAALVLSKRPLDTRELKSLVLGQAEVVGSLTGLVATSGRLDVGRALLACSSATTPDTLPEAPPSTTGLGAATPGQQSAADTVTALAINAPLIDLPFNYGAGTPAADVSGNGNHGSS